MKKQWSYFVTPKNSNIYQEERLVEEMVGETCDLTGI